MQTTAFTRRWRETNRVSQWGIMMSLRFFLFYLWFTFQAYSCGRSSWSSFQRREDSNSCNGTSCWRQSLQLFAKQCLPAISLSSTFQEKLNWSGFVSPKKWHQECSICIIVTWFTEIWPRETACETLLIAQKQKFQANIRLAVENHWLRPGSPISGALLRFPTRSTFAMALDSSWGIFRTNCRPNLKIDDLFSNRLRQKVTFGPTALHCGKSTRKPNCHIRKLENTLRTFGLWRTEVDCVDPKIAPRACELFEC